MVEGQNRLSRFNESLKISIIQHPNFGHSCLDKYFKEWRLDNDRSQLAIKIVNGTLNKL